MRITLFSKVLFWGISIHLASCTQETDLPKEVPDSGLIRLNCVLEKTRANMEDTGKGVFEQNDKIGVYLTNEEGKIYYQELSYNGTEWLPLLDRNEYGKGSLRISAHYPAQPDSDNPEAHSFKLSSEQNSDEYGGSDLLYSSVTLPESNSQATLTFRHILHRLKIKPSQETEKVKVRTHLLGTVNLLSGESSAMENTSFEWISPSQDKDGSYSAIIYPQSTKPYQEEEGFIKVTANGKETLVKAPQKTSDDKAFTQFEPYKQTQINLDIKSPESVFANKAMWVYGVNAPDHPGKDNLPVIQYGTEVFPEGQWFRFDNSYMEEQYLTWKEGCGWYDCNKSAGYNENDANLCWAASASNLIIWWITHNKAYIEAYDKEYGSAVHSTVTSDVFERPSSEFKPLYSQGTVNRAPVFEFFKSSFPDIGSWTRSGVNWFFTGNVKQLLTPNIKGFPGFFHHVFSKEDAIAVDSKHNMNKKEFNDFIKDAFVNKKAIGMVVNNMAGPTKGNHALVIWGAEFDEEGMVSHIYYCENNFSDSDANGAVMKRVSIVYITDNSIPELGPREYTYLKPLEPEDGPEPNKYQIINLCAIDLRHDIWAKKYPHVVAE